MPPKRRAYGEGALSQRKDGLWVGLLEAGTTPQGTRRRIRVSAKTKEECRRKLRDARLRRDTVGAPPPGVSTRTTVKMWAEKWLELTQRKLRPMTWKTNAGCVRKWIIPTIGNRRLDALAANDIRAVQDAQRDAGLKPSSYLRTHAVLIKMLRAAEGEGHVIPKWAFSADRPTANESDRKEITAADAMALLRAAGQLPDGSRWLVGVMLGLRQSEALGLTWDRVDLDRGVADVSTQLQSLPWEDRAKGIPRVPDGFNHRQVWKSYHLVRPKTKAGIRVVPLVPPVVAALQAWRPLAPANPAGLIWPRPDGTPRSAKLDNEQWRAVQDVAGIKHPSGRYYTTHELRHTNATLLMRAGVDPKVRQAILGHASGRSTDEYLHVDQDEARIALTAVAERLQLD